MRIKSAMSLSPTLRWATAMSVLKLVVCLALREKLLIANSVSTCSACDNTHPAYSTC